MALSDLSVFSEYAYSAMSEVLDQEVDKFNSASRGTIALSNQPIQGDYSDTAFWKKLTGLVRRRNPYGSGAVSAITLEHLVDTMVKVAAGTAPVNIDPGQFRWIQRSPEEAGTTIGQQLAGDNMADKLNIAIGATTAALSQHTEVTYNGSAAALSPSALVNGARLFGDRSEMIQAWICHSGSIHDFYLNNLANAERLFSYGSVNVIADPFGRVFIVTDSTNLIDTNALDTATVDRYNVLGLVPQAVVVAENGDFDDNIETSNGDENLLRTWQAEWSYNLGIKGFTWDKTNGGAAPNDAALLTATNWDKHATSFKDVAGVVVQTRLAADV